MKAAKRPAPDDPALADEAADFTTAIRGYGRYDHVTVKAAGGFLYVHADDEPVLRLKPLSRGRYGLSFHHHTGRWVTTPFAGDLIHIVGVLTREFGAHLDSLNFSPMKSGPTH